jgi:hypothetical protein
MMLPVAVALVHHPVVDRRGDLVTTAVTNLDLHDIARAGRTFGVARFFVITPVPAQRLLVDRILEHWRHGFGAAYNADRAEALALMETAGTLEEAMARWEKECGGEPLPVLTGAAVKNGISFARCRTLGLERPLFLIFGTGWGLAPELFKKGWTALDPVRGKGMYNHLSVRSAAAIIFDRLLGDGET